MELTVPETLHTLSGKKVLAIENNNKFFISIRGLGFQGSVCKFGQ